MSHEHTEYVPLIFLQSSERRATIAWRMDEHRGCERWKWALLFAYQTLLLIRLLRERIMNVHLNLTLSAEKRRVSSSDTVIDGKPD